ncbi:MAG TPA: DinB family protein [Methylomirabilota bacterium]|nr:DinB family protein [Methylomirabilota bacterium]HEV8615180.1 DinB family protein [Methylomirabilota bacterium]
MCRRPHQRLGRRGVMNALRAAPRALALAVRGASRSRLRRRPAPGEWSATEVLGHLLDAEVTIAFRMRKVAAEPGSAIAAWDQERWTETLQHRRGDARGMLAAFAALRAANVEQARRLSPAQRRQAGRHPEYGRMRISQMLEHWAEHDLNHIEQIRGALRPGRA